MSERRGDIVPVTAEIRENIAKYLNEFVEVLFFYDRMITIGPDDDGRGNEQRGSYDLETHRGILRAVTLIDVTIEIDGQPKTLPFKEIGYLWTVGHITNHGTRGIKEITSKQVLYVSSV